jgi:hypothetical protein|tara:strand:+ start:1752 stop:2555 length:804 start_codon:yes stop_codon:yes gene_type:complete
MTEQDNSSTVSEENPGLEQGQDQAQPQATENKEEKENQPKPEHPRFNQVYGRWKESERIVGDLRQQNEALSSRLESLEEKHNSSEINSKKEEYKQAIREASETGDNEKVAELNLSYAEFVASQNKPEPKKETQSSPSDSKQEQEMRIFQTYNPWYGTDNAKTDLAHKVNNEMLQDPEWGKKTNAEFLAEVSRRVNTEHSVTQESKRYSSQDPVDGVSSQPPMGSSDEVSLSEAEKRLAIKMLYVPGTNTKEDAMKRYQKQKQLLKGA